MSGSTRGEGRARRALVTGGAGFIGSHLAEALLERGDRVMVLDNLSTGSFANIAHLADHPHFSFAIENITNAVVLDRLMSECDVVFHLAAAVGVELIVRDPVHVIESNIFGSHAVLSAAARYRRTVLVASTSEIYGKSEKTPFAEDDDRLLGPTTRARWSYSTSKAMSEYLALAFHRTQGLPVVIFRLFNTVGPRQTGRYGMVIPRFVAQALAGEPLTVYGDGRQSRSFCDVADAVRAIVALAESEAAVGRVFNVGAAEEITIENLARRVLRLVGVAEADLAGRLVHVPYDQAYADGFEDMLRRVPDTTRLRELTGWTPRVSLDETLGRVVDHLRGAGR